MTSASELVFCNARWDHDGAYLGPLSVDAALARVGEDRWARQDFGEGGFHLVGGDIEHHVVGDRVQRLVASPDGHWIATVERSDSAYRLYLRRGADGSVAASRTIAWPRGVSLDGLAIGISSGAVLFVDVDPEADGPAHGIRRLHAGGREDVVLDGPILGAAFSRSGDAMAVVRPSGRLERYRLPLHSMEPAHELAADDDGPHALGRVVGLAVGDGGEPVAVSYTPSDAPWGAEGRFVVLKPNAGDAALQLILDEPRLVSYLSFAPGGQTLVAGVDGVSIYRRRASPASPPPADASYHIATIPEGWEAAVDGPRGLTLTNDGGSSWAGHPRQVGLWGAEGGRAYVQVWETDAAEFARVPSWSDAVVARYAAPHGQSEGSTLVTLTRDNGDRELEYAHSSGACDPRDRWMRIAERGARLVHMELAIAPNATDEERQQWLSAFLDEPLGSLDGPRAALRLGPSPRGGC